MRSRPEPSGRLRRRLPAWLALAAALAALAPPLAPAADPGTLCIVGPGARLHRFQVEIADTPSRRAVGLMHRTRLAPDAGMLFLHDSPQRSRMWMKNTFVSLDMLFIDERGRVARIARRTEPLSERIIDSGEPVVAVLEILGGRSAELGIRTGDRVLHPHFGSGCPQG